MKGTERWAAILLLLGYSGAVVESVKAHLTVRFVDQAPVAPSWTITLTIALQIATLVGTFALCLWRRHEVARRLRADRAAVALVALAAVSVVWSPSRGEGFMAVVRLAGAVCLGGYLAERFGPEEQMCVWRRYWLIAIAASVWLALATPYGVMRDEAHDGAWRGAFANRNQLGAIAGLGVLLFSCRADVRGRARLGAAAAALVGAVVLVGSGSRGGVVALVLAGGAMVGVRLSRGSWRAEHPALAAALAATIGAVALGLPTLMQVLGGDASLRGRAELWSLAWKSLREAPWLGHGYGAFWTSPAAGAIRRTLASGVDGAHNGFIQLWLELGVVAVALMLIHYGRALAQVALAAEPWRPWVMGLLIFWGVRNLGEVSALVGYGADAVLWIAYLTTTSSVLRPRPKEPRAVPTRPKVGLVCSSGGHFFELFSLRQSWEGLDHFWVTFPGSDTDCLLVGERRYGAYHPTNRNVTNLLRNTALAVRIIIRERPDIVVSTGAGVAVPFIWVGRLFGVRTVYIESIAAIRELSLSGFLVYPVVHELLVQWPAAQKRPKARFVGRCA